MHGTDSLNVRLKAAKNLLSQSVEYSMHRVNYAKREQEKPLLFKLTKVTFHTITSSIRHLSRAISRVWPVNT